MSVDECIERYPKMARSIFGNRRTSLRGVLRSRYDAKYLEKEIKAIVEERLPSSRERGEDFFNRARRMASPDDLCKT